MGKENKGKEECTHIQGVEGVWVWPSMEACVCVCELIGRKLFLKQILNRPESQLAITQGTNAIFS